MLEYRSGFQYRTDNGAVAQLGERVVRNDEVGSSILLGSTIKSKSYYTARWRFSFGGALGVQIRRTLHSGAVSLGEPAASVRQCRHAGRIILILLSAIFTKRLLFARPNIRQAF